MCTFIPVSQNKILQEIDLYMLLGPVLVALWSKALPQTASCLSALPGFEFRPGHVRKLLVTWGSCRVVPVPSTKFNWLVRV